MTFQKTFSSKQKVSIILFVMGLIGILGLNRSYAEDYMAIVSIIFIGLGINNFVYEFIRKRKILKRFEKNHYDSKGEKTVADYLKRKNIAFNHHPTIKVQKFVSALAIPFGSEKIEPDFYLPEFDVFVEYWGMIDNPEYKEKQFKRKRKLYKDNNLDLLDLYPRNLNNLDFVFTSKLLECIKKREGINRKWR